MDCSLPGFSVHERGRQYSRQDTGVGCRGLLSGIGLIQGLNPSLVSPALAGGFPLAPSGKPPTNSQLLYKTSPKREFIKPTFKILAQRLHSLLRHPISMRSFIHSFDHSHSFKQILSTFSKPLQMLLYVELVFSFP